MKELVLVMVPQQVLTILLQNHRCLFCTLLLCQQFSFFPPKISHLFLITSELKLQQEVAQLIEAAEAFALLFRLWTCLYIFINPFKMNTIWKNL